MKKAQMEIMGLAIIIILLMLGMIFLVKFMVLDEKRSIKADFSRKQVAQNFLNAMLITNVDVCNDATVSQIITECYEGGSNIQCGANGGACDYLRNSLKSDFFTETLDKWHLAYRFYIDLDKNPVDINFDGITQNNECKETTIGTTYDSLENAQAKIGTLSGATILVNLDLCS